MRDFVPWKCVRFNPLLLPSLAEPWSRSQCDLRRRIHRHPCWLLFGLREDFVIIAKIWRGSFHSRRSSFNSNVSFSSFNSRVGKIEMTWCLSRKLMIRPEKENYGTIWYRGCNYSSFETYHMTDFLRLVFCPFRRKLGF